AIVIGYLIYRGGLKLNMRAFFRVTGVMILLVAAYLLKNGIHELQEIGWIPAVSGLQPAAWIAYLGVTGFLFFRPQPAPVPGEPART
ncbi:MAG TPA: FTR1 family protein, partial [Actinomycetota bacterium]